MVLDYNIIPKREINKRSGVYILTPYSTPRTPLNKSVIVKIGKAYNLHSRIDGYHTCMPQSFWLYSVIRTSKVKYNDLEREIHNRLQKYIYKHQEYEARYKGEWYKLPKKVLRDTIQDILQQANYRFTVVNVHPEYFAI